MGRVTRCAVITGVLIIGAIVLTNCVTAPAPTMESWDHVIAEENFAEDGDLFTYRYEDPRFNETDWYDVWMDDSFWHPEAGYSRFVDVFNPESGVFMYAISFHDGYIEFPSYGTELTGATLRFYRVPVR